MTSVDSPLIVGRGRTSFVDRYVGAEKFILQPLHDRPAQTICRTFTTLLNVLSSGAFAESPDRNTSLSAPELAQQSLSLGVRLHAENISCAMSGAMRPMESQLPEDQLHKRWWLRR